MTGGLNPNMIFTSNKMLSLIQQVPVDHNRVSSLNSFYMNTAIGQNQVSPVIIS